MVTTVASSENGNGSWRNVVIAILSTALITSTVGWFSFGKDTVRRDELRELQSVVRSLSEGVQALNTTTAVLSSRLERGLKP